MATELDDLKARLKKFAIEREWEKFDSPKNFSMALIVECAELVEHFQWLTEDQSKNLSSETLEEVRLEMADVFIYLTRLADMLNIDLFEAANDKIKLNAIKYPVEKSRGVATKYTKL